MGSVGSDGTGASADTGGGGRNLSGDGVREWVLVDGDRLLLTVAASVAAFVLFVGLDAVGAIAFTDGSAITRMGSGMIAGTFSLVTLVVSVNQLILSQEFTPAGQFRDRLEGVMAFRRDIEDATDVPASPAAPTRLLELLSEATSRRATALADAVADHDDEGYRDRVTGYAEQVADNTDRIDETLEGSGVRAFDALTVTVEYDDAWQLYVARHLRNQAPALSAETATAFDELIETLRLFATAQEHFKTIYLQRELTRFSQLTIYCGVPAVVASLLLVLLYGDIGGTTVAVAFLPYAASLLATVALVPLILLAAYILRTATLTRRTAAIGPILPETDPTDGPFEGSDGDG